MEERRAHPRYAAVQLLAAVIGADGESPVIARDLSEAGICIVSKEHHEPGSRIRVRLTLDFGEQRFSEPFEALFRVVWCTPIKDVFQIGAALAMSSGQERQLLATFVHFMERNVSLEGELRFQTRG
jgi:hypothetical protein